MGNDVIEAVEESRRLNHHKDGKEACAHEYEHRHFLKLLMDLPPAPPEREKGHWVKDGHHIECNKCGTYMCDTDREGDPIPRSFCPNCGTPMEREVWYEDAFS